MLDERPNRRHSTKERAPIARLKPDTTTRTTNSIDPRAQGEYGDDVMHRTRTSLIIAMAALVLGSTGLAFGQHADVPQFAAETRGETMCPEAAPANPGSAGVVAVTCGEAPPEMGSVQYIDASELECNDSSSAAISECRDGAPEAAADR